VLLGCPSVRFAFRLKGSLGWRKKHGFRGKVLKMRNGWSGPRPGRTSSRNAGIVVSVAGYCRFRQEWRGDDSGIELKSER